MYKLLFPPHRDNLQSCLDWLIYIEKLKVSHWMYISTLYSRVKSVQMKFNTVEISFNFDR